MNLDRFVARSQFSLAAFAIIALVSVILMVIFFAGDIGDEALTLLSTLSGGLLLLAKDAYAYFFQRQRPANGDGVPDETTARSNRSDDLGSTVRTTGPTPTGGGADNRTDG